MSDIINLTIEETVVTVNLTIDETVDEVALAITETIETVNLTIAETGVKGDPGNLGDIDGGTPFGT